ncbi:MAG: hypothetical protein OXF42_07005 [Candidatus Dadabacteria bacterium]|nr:hypothetical protein [Candidatus Dadabacteria bacterium]MCY4047832.1 hypothetical protein [Candidatus Dadabacteria bacterium]
MRRALIIAAAAFFSVSGVLFVFEVNQFLSIRSGTDKVKKRIARLAARRDRLNALSSAALNAAGNDPHTERLIREKLGLIKRGEKVFIFDR